MSIDTKALLDGVRERLHRLAKRNDLPTGLRESLVLCASETGTAADRLAELEADNARLRSLLRALLHDVKFAISSGDWRVDGRCDPTITIERAEEALAAGGDQ